MYFHIRNSPPGLIERFVRPWAVGMGDIKTAEFAATSCAQVEAAGSFEASILRAFIESHDLQYTEHEGTLRDAADLPGGSARHCPHH